MPCGHAVTSNGFNHARQEVLNGFLEGAFHRHLRWADWGNTRTRPQCNGNMPVSDGYAAYVAANHDIPYDDDPSD